MKFLKLFEKREQSMSVVFDTLKNKVAIASATISHLAGMLVEKEAALKDSEAKVADLTSKLAAVPAPTPVDVTDADYEALSQSIDAAAMAAAAALGITAGTEAPATTTPPGEPVPVDSTLAVEGISHPAFS